MRALPLNLFMTADAVGGVFTYALDLARALAPLEVGVTLVVLGPAMSERQHAAALATPGLSVIWPDLPLDWLARSDHDVRSSAEALADLARGAGADVVQLNAPSLALADYPAPVVGVAHSCVASWWGDVKSGPLPVDFAWRTRLMREGIARADALVCPSHAYAGAVRRLYGARPIVVHNGRDRSPALPSAATVAPSFAFTAGRLWDEGKNAATLDAAARDMDVPLLLAGPLEAPHGERFASRHAKALGPLAEKAVRERLARRPAFVSAALYEPFGLSVLEAAQAGCPLVLSDIPTFRELWEGAALFVAARDAAGFAEAVNRLARNAELSQRFGVAASNRACAYGVHRMASAMANLYRALVARAGRPQISLDGAAA
ncbi:MAG TPA: glycosyltransferase family 4 protein [Methylocystis sp.]|jgi:glycosyltransferase involved in cell wall biosynthesis